MEIKVEEKLTLNEYRETYIGKMPLVDYLYVLDHKYFNEKKSIEYTKEMYGVDLTDFFQYKCHPLENVNDPYGAFEKSHPVTKEDDGTRAWFSGRGRSRYIKYFRYMYGDELIVGDYFLPFFKSSQIHHIYPLVNKDSNNHISNLVQVCDEHHDILHSNPLQYTKKYCYQSVDYLYYLYHGGLLRMLDKHSLTETLNKLTLNMAAEIIRACVKQEMFKFYTEIEHEDFLQREREKIYGT
jgi:hypothetical protein